MFGPPGLRRVFSLQRVAVTPKNLNVKLIGISNEAADIHVSSGQVGRCVEEIEEVLLSKPKSEAIENIHRLKRELLFMRKSVWPLREAISALQRTESPLIRESTAVFLNDVYDHTIQVIDTVETFRDMVSGMVDLYLSLMSNKMNEVMKVLTIIATLFIPLTFIVGIYGMNFEHMPELKWTWGYAGVWVVMAGTAAGMVVYFKRKHWG